MPKVAQYEANQVQTQIVSQPLAKDAPAAAFGAPIAKGVLDVAQAGFELKQRVDTTTAEETLVNFERDKNDLFFNPDTGYFNTAGRDAYDNSVAATKALEDLKAKYGETLNQQSKQLFDKAADVHILRGQTDIAKHSAKGLKTWEVATLESQVENTIENASLYWNDPDRLKVQNIVGRQAIIDSADMMGIGAEAKAEKLQTFESSFAKASIEAALQVSSVDGKEAMSNFGDKLEGPDKVKLETLIGKKVKVEKSEADSKEAVLKANLLVDTYDSRGDIMEEISNIKDPELQKKTRIEATAQFNQKRAAEKEKQNTDYQAAIAAVNKGATPIQVEAQNPEAWVGMTDLQRNNILSGKHMITDQRVFNEIMSASPKEKRGMNANDFSHQVNPSDLRKISKELDKAKNYEPSARAESLSKKFIKAAKLTYPGKWATTRNKKPTPAGVKADELMKIMRDAVTEFNDEKGKNATPAEEDKVIGYFTRQVAAERSRFGYDILRIDTNLNLSNTPAKDIQILNQIIDLSVDDSESDEDKNQFAIDLTNAYQNVIDKGEPVTAINIQKSFKAGTE